MKLEATFYRTNFQRHKVYRFSNNMKFVLQNPPSGHFKTTNVSMAMLVRILYNYKAALINGKKSIALSRFGGFTFV